MSVMSLLIVPEVFGNEKIIDRAYKLRKKSSQPAYKGGHWAGKKTSTEHL